MRVLRLLFKGLLVIVAILTVAPLVGVSLQWIERQFRDWPNNSIIAPEIAEQLRRQGKRKQLVSIQKNDWLVDEKSNVIVWGIGQVTLEKPEDIVAPSADLVIMAPEAKRGAEGVNGPFNNVVVLKRSSDEMRAIFEERLAISYFQFGWNTTVNVLILFGIAKDTNRDGILDTDDQQNVFFYFIDEGRLARVDVPEGSPIGIANIPDPDHLVITAWLDRDKNGERDWEREPLTLYRIDLKTLEIKPYFSKELMDKFQRLLDAPVGGQSTTPSP